MVLGALLVCVMPARAAVIFNFQFDGTFDGTVTAPIVGTGTVTLGSDPGNGDFAFTSLNPTISFTFGAVTFTQADLTTPTANILIRISDLGGGNRGMLFGGTGGGPQGGSMDFANGSDILTLQPAFGPLYQSFIGGGTFQGINSAPTVPEPS